MKKNLFIICLAALPLMAGCGGNSKENGTLLNEANKILTEKASSVNTCYDAVNLVGDKLAKVNLSGDKEFAYDSVNKKFVIMEGDNITTKSSGYTPSTDTLDYFKFVTTYNPNSKYSQYLLKEAPAMDALLITTGFDAGTHKDLRNVAYANESRDGRNVLIRVYCDYLSVLAPTQTITHYEDATNVIVTECTQYNEHGESAYMKAVKGNVYVSNDESCQVDMFERDTEYEDQVTLDCEKDSKIYGLINYERSKVKTEIAECSELKCIGIDTPENFRKYASTDQTYNFLRLSSDILFEGTDLPSIIVDHQLCIDLNGFKLSFSDFALSSSSQLREAMRIQSSYDTGTQKAVDKSVYLIDSQGQLDEHSGISLNNCSIVVAGSESASATVVPSSNFILNSGKITQTIEDDTKLTTDPIGAAVTVLGKTKTDHPTKNANFTMYGGKISCNNKTSDESSYGCVAAVGSGSHINVEFGVLSSTDFCIYGSQSTSSFKLDDASVIVQGGTLSSDRNTCMYFPSTTDVKIEGGKITGETCITATSGTLNISKSTKLTATGSGEQYSGRNYDGSVIYIPKDKYDDAELTITIEDSTLTSKHEYIANVKEAANDKKTTFNFNSGSYNYKVGDGLLIADESLVTIAAKNGTWTKSQY